MRQKKMTYQEKDYTLNAEIRYFDCVVMPKGVVTIIHCVNGDIREIKGNFVRMSEDKLTITLREVA